MQAPARPVEPPKESLAELEAQQAAIEAKIAIARAARAKAKPAEQQLVLTPASPSPKKRKLDLQEGTSYNYGRVLKQPKPPERLTAERVVKPSGLLPHMTKQRALLKSQHDRKHATKSTSFAERPSTAPIKEPEYEPEEDLNRDDSLALIEKLEPGPLEFTAKPEDPGWNRVEPYSKINLRSRTLSHQDFQEHMTARYFLGCSQLYSVARPGRGNDMDVPIEGDFIIIGVLAEKSDIRITAKPQQAIKKPPKKKKKEAKDEDLPADAKDDDDLKDDGLPDDDDEPPSWAASRKPKRYIIFKLLDMRKRASASSGDSYLNLILFESDTTTTTFDASEDEDETTAAGVHVMREGKDKRKKESYRGGSGGAYERFWKEDDGAVVAILNPKVLKPRPAPGRPTNNVLTITPESAESIIVIGKARDLGKCPALKRDGNVCGSSFDKRSSSACDFHVASALQKTRSGRSELMSGTSSLTSLAGGGKRDFKLVRGAPAGFDPWTKTGLLPRDGRSLVQGAATYVVGGSRSNAPKPQRGFPSQSGRYNDALGGYVAPDAERDKQENKKRKAQKAAEEAHLLAVLQRDANKSIGAKYLSKPSGNKVAKVNDDSKKRVFNATSLRAIGFDPTSVLARDEDEEAKRRRLEAVSLLDVGKVRTAPKLGPAPGQEKKRSNVQKPKGGSSDEGSDEDDLVILKPQDK